MRKLLAILLALMVTFSGISYAGEVRKEIIDELLDDDPTSVTSSTFYIQDYEKIAFFVDYDETEVGNAVSGAVTLEISYDDTTWLSASFYDYAGGATLQTSETLSADGWYYCWFNPDLNVRYVRMVVTGTNTDADDTIDVQAYMIGQK